MVDFRDCDRSALGHAWYETADDSQHANRVFSHRIVVKCERCDTRRVYGLNIYGEIEARWYEYPEGWKERWSGFDGERPSAADIRLMLAQKRVSTRRTTKKATRKQRSA